MGKDTIRIRGQRPKFLEQLKLLQETKEFHESMDSRVVFLKEVIKTTKPIGIIQAGDLHIGARGTNYNKLISFTNFVSENRAYFKVGFLGDQYDNFLHFPSLRGAQESVEPPPMQIQTVVDMLTDFENIGVLSYIVLGNHEIDREEKAVGYSVLRKALPESIQQKVFEGTGEVLYRIGSNRRKYVSYRGVLSHKGRGSSKKNPVHSAMELARDFNYPDFTAVGHTHRPGIMHYYEAGRQIIAIKCGTFKESDSHSQRHFSEGVYGTPVLVIHPDTHHMLVFFEPIDALEYLKRFD